MGEDVATKKDARIIAGFFFAVRQQRRLSQEKFAEALDVEVRFLQDIEYGKKVPSSAVLVRCLRLADESRWERFRAAIGPEDEPGPAEEPAMGRLEVSPA